MPANPVECYIGPSGYPVSGVQPTQQTVFHMGLTKREEFAARAMEGLLSNPNYDTEARNVAFDAVKEADDLLAELAKGGAS